MQGGKIMKISILMLTHNAPRYVFKTIRTLRKNTKTSIVYELIVVDNKSHFLTRMLVKWLRKIAWIDKLKLNEENELFAKGNNTASKMVSEDSTHYLLLNSDIKIKDSAWLDKLVSIHPKERGGVSAFGAVLHEPIRADGYCFFIDRWIYDKYGLEEEFAWWWSVTKLQSKVLQEGLPIYAVKNHENLIYHYGGRSGKVGYKAMGMDTDVETIKKWFTVKRAEVRIFENIDEIERFSGTGQYGNKENKKSVD